MNSNKEYRYGTVFVEGEQRYFRILAGTITTEDPLQEPVFQDPRVDELTEEQFEEALKNDHRS